MIAMIYNKKYLYYILSILIYLIIYNNFNGSVMNMFKLYTSFIVIIVIAFLSAIFTIDKMKTLTDNTKKIYTHPFQVNNSVSSIQTSIITMHRNMKDIVLTDDTLETIQIIEAIQQEEEKVYDNFDIIYKYYLGNKKDIDTLYNTFKAWKKIRRKVITLVHDNKVLEATNITKNEGKKHIDNLYKQIDILKNYAHHKADEFYKSSMKKSTINQVIASFFFSMLFSGIIIIYIVLNLLKINHANKKKLHLIDQNILTAKINLDKNILSISNALCRELSIKRDDILGTKCQYFFTNKLQYEKFEYIIYSAKVYKGEVYIQVKNKKIWFYLEVFPELDKNFQLIAFSLFLTNISDKKRIEEVSIKDSLTGLYNRNYFEIIFEKEVRRAKRDKKALSMIMLDIDYFKQFNDSYGHQEGDNALKAISHVLLSYTNRSYDYAFRIGGEEFVVLSYQKDYDTLKKFANTLLKEIESLKILHKNNLASTYLTASAGVIQFGQEHLLSPDAMYKEVDKLLYEAKHDGRNNFKSLKIG